MSHYKQITKIKNYLCRILRLVVSTIFLLNIVRKDMNRIMWVTIFREGEIKILVKIGT